MKALTAYQLSTGHAIYWTGECWSVSWQEALRVETPEQAEALLAQGQRDSDRQQVLGAYLIDLVPDNTDSDNPNWVPKLMRERHRANGPSIAVAAEAFERLKAEYGEH